MKAQDLSEVRAFVAQAQRVGLSELSARRLHRRIGQVTRAVALGKVLPVDGLEAVRILGERARERDARLAVAS